MNKVVAVYTFPQFLWDRKPTRNVCLKEVTKTHRITGIWIVHFIELTPTQTLRLAWGEKGYNNINEANNSD